MKLLTTLLGLGLALSLNAQISDFTPQTPLLGALLHNDSDEARRLLHHGADPNQGHFNGFPPFMLAIIRQDVDLFRLFAAKGANLNFRDRDGSTPLMWAAFNESGAATMVEELLQMGADPLATNKAGETALTWALQRGETPAVQALRNAGLSNVAAIGPAIEKSIQLLQSSGTQFTRVSGCTSCHHQAIPQLAFEVARKSGIAVDESAALQQVASTMALLKSVADQAIHNRDRIPDVPISVSYALVGLAAEKYPRDETIDAMATVVAAWQSEDGAFYPVPPMRPPLEASAFTATAMSLRALQLYGYNMQDRVERAGGWLAANTPHTNEDRAMQLLGLAWTRSTKQQIDPAVAALLAEQRQDGGWSQLPTLETDAYATGQALSALAEAGVSTTSPEYQRGVAYLLRTQFPDGSWLVRSRSFPVQPRKDSGFPHGNNQWVSAAGTSWAVRALAAAIQ